jgi:C4-type Zn-finger protein
MLRAFAKAKTIDVTQLSKMDALIKQSDEDQIRVLNSHLSLQIQRIMFGAIRNINTTLKTMKEKLMIASSRGENPTTAEEALELIEYLSDVAKYVDPFMRKGIIILDPNEMFKLSRMLYRKAKSFGFSEDEQRQLREAGITEEEVESFVNNFDKNACQELDIEEEVRSSVENSD